MAGGSPHFCSALYIVSILHCRRGRVAEWFKAPVLKTNYSLPCPSPFVPFCLVLLTFSTATPCPYPAQSRLLLPRPVAIPVAKTLGKPVGRQRLRPHMCVAKNRPLDLRVGSLADIGACPTDVRFTPNSGHSSAQSKCPLWAKSRRFATPLPDAPRPRRIVRAPNLFRRG